MSSFHLRDSDSSLLEIICRFGLHCVTITPFFPGCGKYSVQSTHLRCHRNWHPVPWPPRLTDTGCGCRHWAGGGSCKCYHDHFRQEKCHQVWMKIFLSWTCIWNLYDGHFVLAWIWVAISLLSPQLQRLGYTNVDALDASESMLKKASEKKVYKNLFLDFLGPNKLKLFDSMYLWQRPM